MKDCELQTAYGSSPGPVDHTSFPVTHPEVEPVPGLFLRVDAVGFGPADGPDVGLMALLEVDELEDDMRATIKMNVMTLVVPLDIKASQLTSSPI